MSLWAQAKQSVALSQCVASRLLGTIFIGCTIASCGGGSTTDPTPLIPDPVQGESRRTIQLSLPPSSPVDAGSLHLTAGVHAAALGQDGSGVANLDPSIATLLTASNSSGPVVMAIATGSTTGSIGLSARSTAETLVFLHPALATSASTEAQGILQSIQTSSRFPVLVAHLESRLSVATPTPLQPDGTFATLVLDVVEDVVTRRGVPTLSRDMVAGAPTPIGPTAGSGLRLRLLGPDTQGRFAAEVSNDLDRWVRIVLSGSTDGIAYTTSLTDNQSSLVLHRILRRQESVTIPLDNAAAFSRIMGFGLGVTDGFAALDDPDHEYFWWPVAGQVVFEFALPLVEIVAGVKGLQTVGIWGGPGTVGERYVQAVLLCWLEPANAIAAMEAALLQSRIWDIVKPISLCGLRVLLENRDLARAVISAVAAAAAVTAVESAIGPLSIILHLYEIKQGIQQLVAATSAISNSRSLQAFDVREPGIPLGRVFSASLTVTSSGGGTAPSELYRVEPYAFGQDLLLGRIRTAGGFQPAIFDIALSPAGVLWGVSAESHLFSIDTLSALAQDRAALVLPFGEFINALTFDPQGRLLGATAPGGYILTINSSTGATAIAGRFEGGFHSWGDIGVSPGGAVYATVIQGSAPRLVRLDPVTWHATPVGTGSLGQFGNVWGLAFVGQRLLGLTGDAPGPGSLVSIDLTQGTESWVRRLSFNAGGASPAPQH